MVMLQKVSLVCVALSIPMALRSSESATLSQARALIQSGQAQKAEQLLRQALVETPDAAELHGELGDLYYGLKRYEEAVEELGRAAQIDPATPRDSLPLSEVLIALQRF